MKKLVPLLLLLASCEARDSQSESPTIPLDDNLLAGLEQGNTAQDAERLQALIDRAIPAALPANVQPHYRNARTGVGGAACGEVAMAEGRGKPGPWRHFVVTPDAVAVIGTDAKIKFNDPSDFLADAWIRWCASPEELKLVETELDQGPALAADPLPGADIPPIFEESPPAPPRAGLPRRSAMAPSAPPPPAQIDSFSKSVSRPQ